MHARFARRLEGCVTVTPNRRYARALEEAYDAWKLARGERAWARPSITPLPGLLLNEAELLLQRVDPNARILSQDLQRAAFLSVAPNQLRAPENWYGALAQAWRITHLYDTCESEYAHLQTSNTALFDEWAASFRALAKEHRFFTEAELARLLAQALRDGIWHPQAPILPWGYSQAMPLAPAEVSLMDLLRRRQLLTEAPSPRIPRTSSTPRSIEFEQPEDELRAIALWARARLEEARSPVAIGVAFPSLRERRQQIERQFLNQLYPEAHPAKDEDRVFDLAGGTPLLSLSVCESAILLLRFLYSGISIWELERLAESPFLKLGVQLPIANKLRRKLPKSITASDFGQATSGAFPPSLGRFAGNRRVPRRCRGLDAWLNEFRQALHAASWPRNETIDSRAYQQATQLTQLAQQLSRCSSLMPKMQVEDALRELVRAASEREHEIQRASATIRILEIQEAAGLRFTHLWVAGMRNASWPPAVNANPYVPRQSQRQANVPNVTPEDRLNRAKFITKQLLAAAPSVIFSHARSEKDELHSPSALLPESVETDPNFFWPSRLRPFADTSHPYMSAARTRCKRIIDPAAPACEAFERQGTADLLKDHANCPFRSFAIHRLGIEERFQPTDLPDAQLLGTSAHRSIEIAYKQLPDQKSIKEKKPSDLREIAIIAARLAVESELPGAPSSLRTSQTKLLSDMLVAWFECDLKRPDYANLDAEQEIEVDIEGMLLRLKLDRVDQDLDSKKWVVTDYKRSPPSPSSLRSQAPLVEPQLIVYAEALRRTSGRRIVSLAFGALGEADDVKYLHCSADARFRVSKAERVKDMQVLRNAGRRVRGLVRSYLKGSANVSPRRDACVHCHLQSLCRIESLNRISHKSD